VLTVLDGAVAGAVGVPGPDDPGLDGPGLDDPRPEDPGPDDPGTAGVVPRAAVGALRSAATGGVTLAAAVTEGEDPDREKVLLRPATSAPWARVTVTAAATPRLPGLRPQQPTR
jgi:hypothetical protein